MGCWHQCLMTSMSEHELVILKPTCKAFDAEIMCLSQMASRSSFGVHGSDRCNCSQQQYHPAGPRHSLTKAGNLCLSGQHCLFSTLQSSGLQAPPAHAEQIVKHRFPVPKMVVCDQNGSQARFLLARLNPSSSYSNPSGMSQEVIMTDDVSLQVFLDHLRKLAVQS